MTQLEDIHPNSGSHMLKYIYIYQEFKKFNQVKILQSSWRFRSCCGHKCELCWNALELFLLISCQCVLYLLISWILNCIIRIVLLGVILCVYFLILQYSDTDNILTNPDTLQLLMAENKSVIAPMLDSQSAYSNYWCGITPQVQCNEFPVWKYVWVCVHVYVPTT